MHAEKHSHGTITPSEAISGLWDLWERDPNKPKYSAQSSLYRALFCDIAQHFPNFVVRDFSYLLRRMSNEGGAFYLDSLPSLGKAFEASLITGEELLLPPGWEIMKRTRLPKFLFQLFSQLFDEQGVPLLNYQFGKAGKVVVSEEKIVSEEQLKHAMLAVGYIRQTCMMWSKVEAFIDASVASGASSARVCAKSQKALDAFVRRVEAIPGEFLNVSDSLNEARRLLRLVFTTDCPELDELKDFIRNPWGRHGPGAVAGGEVGPDKWSFNTWPGLPAKLFSWREGFDAKSIPLLRQPDARLCLVPKDFRGPRVICIEPKENQFAQQGLMDILYRLVAHVPITRRSISFIDTAKSRQACFDYRYATIDLKDASDTISLVLARILLPRWVYKLVTRYRSRGVKMPDGKTVRSRCLATMGNATCFPLETLIFWALSLGTMIALRDSMPLRNQKYLNLDIRVFGDDIIVPLWACDGVARTLESVGMLINPHKTCSYTPVRESCGEWVFAGFPIKIVRFRSVDVTDYRTFIQWRDLGKDLRSAVSTLPLPALCEEISDRCGEFIVGARKTLGPKAFSIRFHNESRPNMPNYQRKEIFAPLVVHTGRVRELVDASGLYAWHVHNDRTPYLKGARVRVKMRWQDYNTYVS